MGKNDRNGTSSSCTGGGGWWWKACLALSVVVVITLFVIIEVQMKNVKDDLEGKGNNKGHNNNWFKNNNNDDSDDDDGGKAGNANDLRKKAVDNVLNFQKAIAENNPNAVASLFASNAVFCNPAKCVTGSDEILQVFSDYMTNGGETQQRVVVRQIYFDRSQLSGVVEWEWNATAAVANGTVAVGQSYQQDDTQVFRINKKGHFVYWREYFDYTQTKTFYVAPPAVLDNQLNN